MRCLSGFLVVILAVLTAPGRAQLLQLLDNATEEHLSEPWATPWAEQLAGPFHPDRLRAALRETPAFNNASPAAHLCDRHLQLWADGIRSGEQWALLMADSSAKLHAKMLFAQTIDLGSFDNCVSAASEGSDPVSGAYLLPSVFVFNPDKKTMGVTVLAMCVPVSCDAVLVSDALAVALVWLSSDLSAAGYKCNMSLTAPLTPYGRRHPGRLEWVALGFAGGLLLLAVLGAAADVLVSRSSHRKRLQPLLAFSLVSNSRRLTAVQPQPRSRGAFPAINGVRVLSLLWVILAHRWYTARRWPNNSEATAYHQESQRVVFLQALLAVDTFFTIGGLLCCYSFHKSMDGSNKFQFHKYILHRLFRLTPALAACVAFTATWADLLGQGPLRSSQELSETCRTGWWMTLLYIGNFMSLQQCVPQTWYLAADMQLHLLAPLVLLPLRRWPRAGLALLLALILASCVPSFVITLIYDINGPYAVFADSQEKWYVTSTYMYYPFYCRITSYLVGVLTGHLLFIDSKKKLSFLRYKIFTSVCWILSACLGFGIFFWGAKVTNDIHNFHPVESAFYNGVFRLCWGLAICWVFVACATGCGGPVDFVLSWDGFAFFAKLSYCVYLLHYPIQCILDDWKRSAIYYTDITVLSESLSDAALSYIVSIALFLLVEEPFVQLESAMWRREAPKSKQDVSPALEAKKLEGSPVQSASE